MTTTPAPRSTRQIKLPMVHSQIVVDGILYDITGRSVVRRTLDLSAAYGDEVRTVRFDEIAR